jgi:hypothetical protein
MSSVVQKFDWRKADADKARKNAAAIRKAYAKRSSNDQLHAMLVEVIDNLTDVYDEWLLNDSDRCRKELVEAMRVLKGQVNLSRTRLQQ